MGIFNYFDYDVDSRFTSLVFDNLGVICKRKNLDSLYSTESSNVLKMSGYSVEQFEKDLHQLGGMIEGFYQGGGAKGGKRGKRKTKAKKKNANNNNGNGNRKKAKAKPKRKRRKRGGATDRHYKVDKVDGRPYPYYRRYKGAEPKDAALKAFHFVCKKLGQGKGCQITFTLKETSRGSDKRTYGPYKGHYEKLPKPIPIIIKQKSGKMKKVGQRTHKRVVELVRK
jgi:hypothetical protein